MRADLPLVAGCVAHAQMPNRGQEFVILCEARLIGGREASALPPSVVRAAQALAGSGVAVHAVGAALAGHSGRVGHRARGTHLARRSALVCILAHRTCENEKENENDKKD